jgi:lipoteichoic acid synthase
LNTLLGFLRAVVSRHDWVYLLGLLVPFVVYDLALKVCEVASRPGDEALAETFNLVQSDVFFDLGYALLWIGLFAAVRRSSETVRRSLLILFHAMTMLVVLVTTCAYLYFQKTGSTLDYATFTEWIPKAKEVMPVLLRGGSPLPASILLLAALSYAALGPMVVTHVIDRWQGAPRVPQTRTLEISFLGPARIRLAILGCGSLLLLVGSGSASADTPLAIAPFVNVVLTGVEEAPTEENYLDTFSSVEDRAGHASLAETSHTEKRNVVLIHLESTRARSMTPYNEGLKTTPYLDELAKSSLLAERAYVVLPRSSKGSVAVNCGIAPPLYSGPEFEPGNIPAPCLADLLKEQDYSTVLFTSTATYGFSDLVKNLGYQEYLASSSMDKEGFEATNTFGYEDDIMLKPSEEWITKHKDEPFVAEYLTGTGHYGYECLDTHYGSKNFADDEQLNRYLNCLRLQDIFLENLVDQYKELGLYDNTIFVIFGDHGEGLGEHGRYMHGDTIYEEGLEIPLIIHAPGWFEDGQRVEGLSSQIDVVPTVVEMLGYEVKNAGYPGYSLLHTLPEDRTLRYSCISSRECLASTNGYQKYIYHYDDQPDEVFDLSKDPLEKHNLAILLSKAELSKRRAELLAWRSRVNAQYGPILINGTPYSEKSSR